MQKNESQNIEKSDDENLDITVNPNTIINLSESQANQQSTSHENQELAQSDSEIQRKSKIRSRFTSALLKLSRSSKKKRDSTKTQAPIANTCSLDTIVVSTSGDTDQSTKVSVKEKKINNLKKKRSISKHFSLTSLKKSKANLKDNTSKNDDKNITFSSLDHDIVSDSPDIVVPRKTSDLIAEKVTSETPTTNLIKSVEAETSKPNDGISRVQITIKGTKIEHSESNSPKFQKYSVENIDPFGDTDYITPKEEVKSVSQIEIDEKSQPFLTSSTEKPLIDKLKTNTKRLKPKKQLTVSNSKTFQTTSNTNITQTCTSLAQKTPLPKTFAITQSYQDIPPKEKAPNKPIQTNSAATLGETNLTRKPIQRAAATLTSPSITQRFKTTATVATVVRKQQRTTLKSTTGEAKLMQNPLSAQSQRNYNLPEPKTSLIEKAIAVSSHAYTLRESQTPSISTTVKNLNTAAVTTKSEPQNLKKNIELQSNSRVSITQPLPSHTLITKTTKTPAKAKSTSTSTTTKTTKSTITVTKTAEKSKETHNRALITNPSKDLILKPPNPPPSIPESQYNSKISSHTKSNELKIDLPKEVNSHDTPDDSLIISKNSVQKTDSIDKCAIPIEDIIDKSTEPIEDTIDKSTEPIEDTIDKSTEPIEDTIDKSTEPIVKSTKPIEDNINKSTIPIVDTIDKCKEPIEDIIDKCAIPIEDSIKNSDIINQTIQDSQIATAKDLPVDLPTAISFSVGSIVRAQRFLPEEYSFESKKSLGSPDSQSPLSERSRKRIHYVAQPTISDELTSFEVERSAYQAGITSEYSLDSEYDSDENLMPAFGDLTMDQDMEPTVMTSVNTEKREHLYKILVIGELGTGKTSFIKRYVHQFFSQNYRATIGVDFALKVLNWDANTIVRLQLWDIAGQERFGNMTRVYYKEAVGAFIVFDVTRSGTFDCVSKWKEDLDSKVQLPDGNPIPCILLANKCDQEKQGIVTSSEKMDEYVNENGFAGWFETSAKENINIDVAAKALVNKILLNDKLTSDTNLSDNEIFNLNTVAEESDAENKNKCFC